MQARPGSFLITRARKRLDANQPPIEAPDRARQQGTLTYRAEFDAMHSFLSLRMGAAGPRRTAPPGRRISSTLQSSRIVARAARSAGGAVAARTGGLLLYTGAKPPASDRHRPGARGRSARQKRASRSPKRLESLSQAAGAPQQYQQISRCGEDSNRLPVRHGRAEVANQRRKQRADPAPEIVGKPLTAADARGKQLCQGRPHAAEDARGKKPSGNPRTGICASLISSCV